MNMKIHRRKTYTEEGYKLIWITKEWNSSLPVSPDIGDILEVTNKKTKMISRWRILNGEIFRNPKEAKEKWKKYPFGDESFAKLKGYYPYVIKDLEFIEEYNSNI